jgi:hypothetical protein
MSLPELGRKGNLEAPSQFEKLPGTTTDWYEVITLKGALGVVHGSKSFGIRSSFRHLERS